jgi:hypothetical protein
MLAGVPIEEALPLPVLPAMLTKLTEQEEPPRERVRTILKKLIFGIN